MSRPQEVGASRIGVVLALAGIVACLYAWDWHRSQLQAAENRGLLRGLDTAPAIVDSLLMVEAVAALHRLLDASSPTWADVWSRGDPTPTRHLLGPPPRGPRLVLHRSLDSVRIGARATEKELEERERVAAAFRDRFRGEAQQDTLGEWDRPLGSRGRWAIVYGPGKLR